MCGWKQEKYHAQEPEAVAEVVGHEPVEGQSVAPEASVDGAAQRRAAPHGTLKVKSNKSLKDSFVSKAIF